jgi:hypothetical protein
MRVMFLISVLVLTPCIAAAVSSVTDVTTANISTQPLTFRVEHERYDDGMIRFEVYVSRGSSGVSPHRVGRFVIWKEPVHARSGKFHDRSTRPAILAVCSVEEESGDGVLRYEFQADESLLGKVTFSFINYEPGGMPAFDAFEFMLDEFVSPE